MSEPQSTSSGTAQWTGAVPPAPPTPPAPSAPPAEWSVLAIVGFVTSFFVGIVGLILSILGLRDTARTGRRGRGLAIAGIVVGAADIVLGVILVVVLTVAVLPALRRSFDVPISDVASFGRSDDVPAATAPEGAYQALARDGWVAESGSPSSALLVASAGKADSAGFKDRDGVCLAEIGVVTDAPGQGTEYEQSLSLLTQWVEDPDVKDKLTGAVSIGSAPAFAVSGDAAGSYQVVRSSFTDEQGDKGLARARVFERDGQAVGVVTSVLCDSATNLSQLGVPTLDDDMGAAW